MKKKYLYTAIMLFAILVAGMGLTGWYVSQTQEQTDGQELTDETSFFPMYIVFVFFFVVVFFVCFV